MRNPQEPDDHLCAIRRAVLDAALPDVSFDGWSEQTLQAAIARAKIDPDLALLAFPDGVMDLLDCFWSGIDAALLQEMAARTDLSTHLSARITTGLQIYVALLRPHREAVRRALALQALPFYAPRALASLYRTVDTLWRAVGDVSTDFNFYTKRATLAAVVVSVTTHWLGADGEDEAAMDAFIRRRIDNVLEFEKFKARLGSATQNLPSLGALLGNLAERIFGFARRN